MFYNNKDASKKGVPVAIVTIIENGLREVRKTASCLDVLTMVLHTCDSPDYVRLDIQSIDKPRHAAILRADMANNQSYVGMIEWANDSQVRQETYAALAAAYANWLIKFRAAGIWDQPKPTPAQLIHEYLVCTTKFNSASDLIRKGSFSVAQLANIVFRIMSTANPDDVHQAIYRVRSM